MSNKKISELAAANPLGSGDLFEVLQGGVNKKVSATSLVLFVDGETPTGSINGSNTDFVLANTPVSGSVKVFLNGVRQKLTIDYTISGTTITFLVAPVTNDIILCDYRR